MGHTLIIGALALGTCLGVILAELIIYYVQRRALDKATQSLLSDFGPTANVTVVKLTDLLKDDNESNDKLH